MADPAVSERRIRPIQEAVDSGNWKQAIKECDKWTKKGEKSDKFLALKAFILVKQPDPTQHERGRLEITQLCNRTPAITNVDALHQIQDALRDLSLAKQEGLKLWDRAVAANPNDQDLLMTWFHRSVAESSWLSAQKAAMALRKAFPNERKYEFWNILMCYLVHRDTTLPEKDRILFGTLAYRLISKAAEMVPTDKDQLLSSGKAVQTPEELMLLVKIYISTGRAEEAVKLLQSENLGLESRFAKQDPQMVLLLLVDSLESAKMWSEAYTFCEKQIASVDAGKVVDPRLWELLRTAAQKSQDSSSLLEKTRSTAATYSSDRVANQLELSLTKSPENSDDEHCDLLKSCQAYCDRYKRKTFCFEDVREPLGRLGTAQQDIFLKGLKYYDDPQERLLYLKLRYCFQVAPSGDKDKLERFAIDTLRLYHSGSKNSGKIPEAGLIAVLALIKSAQENETTEAIHWEALLQASILLENCQRDSEEYYPFLILSVRIQKMLGLMSLAMLNFKSLNVKNVQYESVGYLLLDRISTTHPRQHGKVTPSQDGGYSPLAALDNALTMFEKSSNTITQQIRQGLKFGSYANVVEAVETRSDLDNSINAAIFSHEHLKIRRLTGQNSEGIVPPFGPTLVDKRDSSFLQSYEISGETPLQSLRLAPLPKEPWLATMNLYNQTYHFLKTEPHTGPNNPAILALKTAVANTSEDGATSTLTSPEIENLAIHKHLATMIILTRTGTAEDQAKLDNHIAEILNWLNAKSLPRETISIRSINAPNWMFLHTSFTDLETLQLLSLFCSSKTPKATPKSPHPSVSKDTLGEIPHLISAAEAAIHAQARSLKEGLNAAGILGLLMDVAFGRGKDGEQSVLGAEIERVVDEGTLEIVCGEVKESWEDAVDGLLGARVR